MNPRWASYGLAGMILLGAGYYLNSRKNAQAPAALATPTPNSQANETSTPAPLEELTLPKAAAKLEPKDQRKLVVLQQILNSHNDNDPRMDTDLVNLSPTVKKAMMSYYSEIAAEKRNDRGTIVFLIGRAISSKADVDFLKSVLMENPCLSLQNCNELPAQAEGSAEHLEGINETTANYPQLNALRAYVSQYREFMGLTPPNHTLVEQVISALHEATRSPNPKVVTEAENALRYLKR